MSDGDLLRRRPDEGRRDWWPSLLAEGSRLGDIAGLDGDWIVREVMTSPLIIVSPSAPCQEIAEILQAHRIKRLPVIESGRLTPA
jgi:CBS domain-containing protein